LRSSRRRHGDTTTYVSSRCALGARRTKRIRESQSRVTPKQRENALDRPHLLLTTLLCLPWRCSVTVRMHHGSSSMKTLPSCFVYGSMTTPPRDGAKHASSIPTSPQTSPSFRLVTVLSLVLLSIVCVVLALYICTYPYSSNQAVLEMMYKIPLQLVIPAIVGGCVHWVALQMYLHN
jgi:hypothetical protein